MVLLMTLVCSKQNALSLVPGNARNWKKILRVYFITEFHLFRFVLFISNAPDLLIHHFLFSF